MPSPSGTSLDVRVAVSVPDNVVENDRDAAPPGPMIPVHVSVTGEVAVVVLGDVSVLDPHAMAPAATAANSRKAADRGIVIGD